MTAVQGGDQRVGDLPARSGAAMVSHSAQPRRSCAGDLAGNLLCAWAFRRQVHGENRALEPLLERNGRRRSTTLHAMVDGHTFSRRHHLLTTRRSMPVPAGAWAAMLSPSQNIVDRPAIHHQQHHSHRQHPVACTAQTIGRAAIPLTSANAGGDENPGRHGPSRHRRCRRRALCWGLQINALNRGRR
jgi:hypothetical protein